MTVSPCFVRIPFVKFVIFGVSLPLFGVIISFFTSVIMAFDEVTESVCGVCMMFSSRICIGIQFYPVNQCSNWYNASALFLEVCNWSAQRSKIFSGTNILSVSSLLSQIYSFSECFQNVVSFCTPTQFD